MTGHQQDIQGALRELAQRLAILRSKEEVEGKEG